MKRIKIDRKKCIGCLTCTTACKVAHGGRDTRGHVVINSQGNYAPIYCRHCTRPECVYACPTGAMQKDNESGYETSNVDKVLDGEIDEFIKEGLRM